MASNKSLLMLPGDGIGPEVCQEVRKVLDWMDKRRAVSFDVKEGLVGGAAYDAHKTAITDETMQDAMDADAVLFGAVGGPQYDNLGWDVRPEAGLLRLRKEMDLFANLRPAVTFDALLDASTLKQEVIQGLDIMIIRELTAGVYFGEPRGMQTLPDGTERCIDTQSYTKAEIERVTEVAFDLARKRNSKVHSVEKANVMKTGVFWRKTVTDLHKSGNYDDIELHHMYADNCGMQLVRNPKQFDVILADTLFGALLSDEAAMLTGSIGMLPSASLGIEGTPGLFEPVHGSAPDIAGKGYANPCAAILSLEMALRWSLARPDAADRVMKAVAGALKSGARTRDIGGELSTSQMADAIIDGL